ncbi:hypothetical protein BDV59DRAFT_187514 [Aspergillus ambiguus]|uniref:uncharacterized protein n=1 Tax=Aspergillus ambiguus TaxID=176160 RepID=UPI003CCDA91D
MKKYKYMLKTKKELSVMFCPLSLSSPSSAVKRGWTPAPTSLSSRTNTPSCCALFQAGNLIQMYRKLPGCSRRSMMEGRLNLRPSLNSRTS